jgi:hypothetical protein
MKKKIEVLLNLAAAAVSLAVAFGLDPLIAVRLLAAISVGFAMSAGLP